MGAGPPKKKPGPTGVTLIGTPVPPGENAEALAAASRRAIERIGTEHGLGGDEPAPRTRPRERAASDLRLDWEELRTAPSSRPPAAPGPPGAESERDYVEDPPTRRAGAVDLTLDEPGPSGPLDLTFARAEPLYLDAPVDPACGDALDMVDRSSEDSSASIVPPNPVAAKTPMADLRERYALGDFSGALVIAEGLLAEEAPSPDVQRYAESCRDVLQQMYLARLGALDQVPSVAVAAEQLRWLTLDHRAGFLLSHVDGLSTLEEILDVSGMPGLEALRIIYDLLQQQVIVLG